MPAPAIEIPIRADTADAKRAISEFASEAFGKLTPVVDVGALIGKAFDLAGRAIGAVTGYLTDSVKAAADAEKTQRLLAAAVGQNYDRLAEYNSALSAKLGIDDDDLAAMQTKLVGLGVQQSKLEDATRATLGLAAATGKDLMAATKQVAAAFVEGGAEAKRLTDLYKVAQQEALTFEGRTRAMSTAFGDLSEAVGGTVVSSRGANDALGALTDGVRDFTAYLASSDGKAMVDAFFVAIAHGAADALDGLAGMIKLAGDLKDRIDDVLGRVTTEAIVEGGGLLGVVEGLADRLRGVRAGQTEGGATGSGNGAGGAKTKPGPRAAGGGSAALSPEAAMGAQGRFSEFDQERERQQMERDRAALEVRQQQIEREQALRDEQRERRERDYALEEEQTQRHYAQLATIGFSGVTGFLQGTITAWASGRQSLEDAAATAFFGMLSQIGQGLFAMGSAAVAAGLLGAVAPIFAPATGGPLGVAAGAGLMAAGLLLQGLGAYGASQVGGGAPSAPSAPRPSSARSSTATGPMGFSGDGGSREPMTTVINVNFGEGLVFGTPRQIGDAIHQRLRQAETLRPGWAR